MTKRLIDATDEPRGSRDDRPQRIAGPAELLQAVPYLLGFHPTRSLVLVGLRDGILVVTARVDLTDAVGGADDVVGAAEADGVLAATLASMCAGGTTEVIGVVYDDGWPTPDVLGSLCRHGTADLPSGDVPWDELPWAGLADRLDRLADTVSYRLLDVLLVLGQRWWSLGCGSAECCPPEGQPLPVAPSPFATRATVDGVVPLRDRAELEAVLDPAPAADRRRLRGLLERAETDAVVAAEAGGAARHERSVKRALFATARASVQARWVPPDDADLARFAVALTATSIRDALWLAVDGRRLDGRPFWRELARQLPEPYDAPALFLYGWASWRAGDGASASMAAERAVASDASYSAADLLLAALSHGLDPHRFPRLNRTA